MRHPLYKTIIVLFLLGFVACKKDKPAAPVTILPDSTHGVLVACEGSLGYGNAALSFYQEGKEVIADIYKAVNGLNLGDVLQSVTAIDDKLYLCVNNSDKILVIGATDFILQASIAVPKPRYIVQVANDKAYVSTLFSNRIFVINTMSNTVTDTLWLPAQNPEEMLRIGHEVFVPCWDTASNKIFVLNTADNEVSRSIGIAGKAPHAVLTDKEGKLWVLSGNNASGVPAALSRLDPATGNLLAGYYFPASADPVRPCFNPAKDTLYWISVNQYGGVTNNGIYRMRTDAAGLPATSFLTATAWQYFWALGIDPATGLIYIGDPKGFTQKGTVGVYQQDGTLKTTFDVGVGPGSFYFQ